MELTGNNSFLF